MKLLCVAIVVCVILGLVGCANNTVDSTSGSDVPTQTATKPQDPQYGYPTKEIQTELVFYNGILYVSYSKASGKQLPDGYTMVGTVATEDGKVIPDQEFAATHVHVGAEIYAKAENTKFIYVKTEDSAQYACFMDSQYDAKWWMPN